MKISVDYKLAYEWSYIIHPYDEVWLPVNRCWSDCPMPTKPGLYLVSYLGRPCIFIVYETTERGTIALTRYVKQVSYYDLDTL